MSQYPSRSTPGYLIGPNPILSKLVVAKTFLTFLDISEDRVTNTVSAVLEFPGLEREDVHTTWDDGEIMVWGETPDVEEAGYSVVERKIGAFCRCLSTPPGTKARRKDVKISHKNGLLTLTFPATPERALKTAKKLR